MGTDFVASVCRDVVVVFIQKLLPYLIRSNFIKTTYDISLDSQISFLPLGFSPTTKQPYIVSCGCLGWRAKVRKKYGEGDVVGWREYLLVILCTFAPSLYRRPY